jgi:hypothetical protein
MKGETVVEQESIPRGVPEGRGKHPPSSREIVVDSRYAELLAEDLGVKVPTARTAFIGEPQRRAVGVVAWAFKHAPDSPEKRAKMILCWAKKRRAGAFAGDSERYFAEQIGKYWMENPDKLAETLHAALGDDGS